MNVVAGDEIYSTHVHVYVCVVQKADEVACEACAALFSHLFLFLFYISWESSDMHFLSPT